MLGFFFRIFLSRTIGAEALGLYQVALSVFMVLLTVVSSGFTLIISRMTAGYRVGSDRKAIGSLVSTCAIIGLVVSVFLCLVIFVFRNLFQNLFTDENCINILIILLPSLVFSAIYSVFRGAMWGNDNYFGLCVSELVEQIVKIVICVLLLASGMSAIQNAMSVAWSFTFSCFVSSVFVVLLYFVYGGKINKPTKIYKSVLKQSAPITAVRVIASFTQPLIALILPAQLVLAGYTSNQAMGLYGIAMGMTFPILFLPSALIGSLATALVPDISMAMVQNDNKHIEGRVKSSLTFAMFVSFLIVPVFVAIGDKFGILLYNEVLSGTLLQMSAWIMIPMGITNITSAILNSVGMEVKSFVNYVVGGVFMFLSIICLTRYIGINALILGMGGSSVISASLNILMLKKKLSIKVGILKNLFLLIGCALPTIAITSFLSSILSNVLPLFFDLAISTFVGVAIYLLLCMVFNVVDISVYLVKIKEKIAKKHQKMQKK
ncbi:MAG: oligosaccharide flippase family protein [Clostridia bacterium]|nr:oligosaccharide flippase family protein [Clostridia bacterium]